MDILVWPQKEGKTVWILGEQQYVGNVVPPFARTRPWFRLSSVGAHGAGIQSCGIWPTLLYAAAQENSWLGYRLGHLTGAHPPVWEDLVL